MPTRPNSASPRQPGGRLVSSSVEVGARLAALVCAGFAAIAVEITVNEGLKGGNTPSVATTSYYAFSAASPTFFITLLCFERLHHRTWLNALLASWPWSFGVVCSVLALMRHRRPWVLVVVMLAALGLDYGKTFRRDAQAPSRKEN